MICGVWHSMVACGFLDELECSSSFQLLSLLHKIWRIHLFIWMGILYYSNGTLVRADRSKSDVGCTDDGFRYWIPLYSRVLTDNWGWHGHKMLNIH